MAIGVRKVKAESTVRAMLATPVSPDVAATSGKS